MNQSLADDLRHSQFGIDILDNRPDVDQLREQGVLPNVAAPGVHVDQSLLATQKQLDKQIKTDKLSQSLNKRTSHHDLQQKGLVENPSKISPAIQEMTKKLEHQKKSDDIKQKLGARQDINEMMDSGLMVADPRKVAGSLAGVQSQISKELENRADPKFLHQTKILKHGNMVYTVYLTLDIHCTSINMRICAHSEEHIVYGHHTCNT